MQSGKSGNFYLFLVQMMKTDSFLINQILTVLNLSSHRIVRSKVEMSQTTVGFFILPLFPCLLPLSLDVHIRGKLNLSPPSFRPQCNLLSSFCLDHLHCDLRMSLCFCQAALHVCSATLDFVELCLRCSMNLPLRELCLDHILCLGFSNTGV